MEHHSDEPLPAFTKERALATAVAACNRLGIASNGARVLKPPADNAVVAIPSAGLLARIGADRSHESRLRTELHAARWLIRRGVPAARPRDEYPQLVHEDGRVITWWELVDSRRSGSPAQLAALLRQLHAQGPPWPTGLPRLDPWVRLREHVEDATGVPASERAFLRRHLEELQAEWSKRSHDWPEGMVHGDAHTGNTLDLGNGLAVLIDLERVSIGPTQWDTAVAVTYHHIGWYDDCAFADYATAYGRDPTHDEGMDLLVRIRMLRMTAWYASRTNREPEIVDDVLHRIATLRDPSIAKRWKPG
ncbi:phosphotransferase enzyme family protein [Streptomyces sp. NPDC048179]|uniref:phosphotransferase enzyme family protein n=1 Tax=Streptomyces sp. NPDC048179 TaxID=3365506 RepID=UPI00371E46DC